MTCVKDFVDARLAALTPDGSLWTVHGIDPESSERTMREPRAAAEVSSAPIRGDVLEGTLRIGPLMALPAVLAEFEVDAVPLLGEFGLSPAHFDDPETVVPFTLMGRVLARCVERTRCEHVGLLVGQRAGLSSLGALGFLMQGSASARIALRHLAQQLHIHDRGAVVTLTEQPPYALLGYAILQQGVERLDQIYAAAIAVGVNLMRGLCGRQWKPTQVHFAFRRPSSVAPYRRALGVAPVFDADATAIVFPVELLDRQPESADPLLYRLMRERVDELDAQMRIDLVAQLRRILRTLLATPDCSLQTVAQRVGMHPRTLNRRLEGAGTTFQELREEARLHAAREMLASTDKAANEIAAMIGYADGSSFSRAFRRWAGTTPAQWRFDERLARAVARVGAPGD